MTTAVLTQTKWGIDTTHTDVSFKIIHLVISTVTGTFKKFNGTMVTENDDFNDATVNFSIDVNSIDTNQADRDGHLKSEDFFAAAKYPSITFADGTLKKITDEEYQLTGDLTIRDVTKPVALNVVFGGIVKDPYGNTKAGFEITGKINRKEFGLSWNAVTEAGGVVVSEEVKLLINAQLVKG